MLEFLKKLLIKLFKLDEEVKEKVDPAPENVISNVTTNITSNEDESPISPEFVEEDTPKNDGVAPMEDDSEIEPEVEDEEEEDYVVPESAVEPVEYPIKEDTPEPVEPEKFNARKDLPAGNVQPIDVFSLALTEKGIKDVTISSGFFTVVSVMCDEDGRVVRDYTDYAGVIGEAGKSYNSHNLNDKWKQFSRGILDLNMSVSEVNTMIEDARERGVYIYGDDHPYNPSVY